MANDDDAVNNGYDNQNDGKVCMVYDKEDFFTVTVQILLAIFALGSLYIKRMQEVPRRTFYTWAMDVSKQAVGACYAHVCNMVSFFFVRVEIFLKAFAFTRRGKNYHHFLFLIFFCLPFFSRFALHFAC